MNTLERQDLPPQARTVLALLGVHVNAELEGYKEDPIQGMSIQSAPVHSSNMAHSKVFFLILVASCLAAVVLSFPADNPLGPGKRIPKGVAPPGGEKDLEGAESYGYGWGYGGWGWGGYGGWGGWGGWGYPGYGYGYGYYGYPWGGYGGYGPYWGGYWW